MKLKAWELEYRIRESAMPDPNFSGDYDLDSFAPDLNPDWMVRMLWSSVVPGSGAPESLILGAIQAVENMGRDVSRAIDIYLEGLEDLEREDLRSLRSKTSRIFLELSKAERIDHPYHSYSRPTSWKDISRDFPRVEYEISNADEKIHLGWLGQIAGASMGTRLEGFKFEALESIYGEKLGYYISVPPSTVNDDIAFEIAFLIALDRVGWNLDSKDIADSWIENIRFGWSAEMVALENIRRGIYPPESGSFMNPFQEWIGAQMRGMVHGLLNPGRPFDAARYAYIDSIVSHSGNGVYGGIHSAVLTSLSFAFEDPKRVILEAEKFVPDGTEFKEVITSTRKMCQDSRGWREVLDWIEERFKTYNWIHLYPNSAIVITTLWFSENFDSGMDIVARSGYDVDCNAGEVGTVLGIIFGVPNRWSEPLKDTLETYVSGYERMKISELSEWTLKLMRRRDRDGG